MGIADTKGAAWALSRFGLRFGPGEVTIAQAGQTGQALAPLPLEALRVPRKLSSDLRRTGLKTIGQLMEIKRAELARRFGLDLTKSLSAALGHAPDPVSPKAADPIYAARMTLPDPIGLQADLMGVLERLTASVCRRLGEDLKGARRYYLTVRCVDTGDHVLQIGFARPTHEARAVMQQFTKPLDTLKIEFGADWFRLEAAHIEPIQPFQISLDQHKQAEDDTSKIISTLGNRLGFDRVRQFQPVQSHLPEREFSSVEAMDRREPASWTLAPRKRPVRLFKRPERLVTLEAGRPPKRFQWRKSVYATQDAKGPERLTAEWWLDDRGPVRDYWQVQTEDGPRLWLMTYPGSAEPNWFIAGRFA
jgi:protein ImuB